MKKEIKVQEKTQKIKVRKFKVQVAMNLTISIGKKQ